MAVTRIYLPSSGSAPASPAIDASWEHQNVVRRPCDTEKSNTANASTAYSPDAADHLVDNDSHFVQFVSKRKLKAQTIQAQTIKWQNQASETNAGNNLFTTIRIWVAAVDDLANLGTILAITRDTVNEVPTTRTNRAFSATSSSVTTTEDGWLVIEVGLGGLPVAAGGVQGHNGTMWFGDDSATDLPEDDTDTTTTKNPWVQFGTDALLFETSGTLSKTLGTLTLASAGTVATAGISGTLNKTLGALTLVSSGVVNNLISGSLNKTLGGLTLNSAGTVGVLVTVGYEKAFMSRGFAVRNGGFLAKSFFPQTGGVFGKQRPVVSPPLPMFLSKQLSGEWPVNKEWFDEVRGDVKSLRKEMGELRTEVSALKVKVSWKNTLVSVLVSLAVAIGAVLLGACAIPRGSNDAALPVTQSGPNVAIYEECVYPADSMVHGPMPSYGSGVAVGPGMVLTARHVVSCDYVLGSPVSPIAIFPGEAMKIVVEYEGRQYNASVEKQGVNLADDFAVLVLDAGVAPFKRWAVPAEHNPVLNDAVCAISTKPELQTVCGIVRLFRTESDVWAGKGYFDYLPEPGKSNIPGNSGSGVFSEYNTLVGILVGGPDDGSYTVVYGVDSWRDRLPPVVVSPEM